MTDTPTVTKTVTHSVVIEPAWEARINLMDHDRAVGTWIRSRRRELDLTREQLAEQVGCSIETIRKIEAAERRPSRQIAERLARALADLGMTALALDDEGTARRAFREVLSGEIAPPLLGSALQALLGMATLLVKVGASDLVAELVAVILRHPASSPESRERAERLWDNAQPGRTIEVATGQHEPGTGRSFDALVAEVLATAQPK
jgi:transcriptional regulator with XRE-family HTH domain